MKKMLTLAFSLGLILQLNAQSNVPSSLAGNDGGGANNYFKLKENYNKIIENQDSVSIKRKKHADRWFFENNPYLEVKADSTFEILSVNKLLNAYIASDLFCKDDNISNWQ